MTPTRLVVLGSSITALAVVRDAHKLKINTVLIDSVIDIAMSSRLPQKHHIANINDVMPLLKRICVNGDVWLIATSDLWLRYIVANREQLDELFTQILHPSNNTLNICLDKQKFSNFCDSIGVPSPKIIKKTSIKNASSEVAYPLFIRPLVLPEGSTKRIVPKAVEVSSHKECLDWLDEYAKVNAEPLITQSLLNRQLKQISIGIARKGNKVSSFVAIKHRPLPTVCAVGTFVEVIIDQVAEKMARKLVEALDYQGITEIEILKDVLSGEYFVIEVNARPWVQYSLGPASGCPLLGFMLHGQAGKVRRKGCWIDLTADTFCCLSRSIGHVRSGEVNWKTWIRDLIRVRNFAYLSLADLLPAWENLRIFFNEYRKKS